MRNDIYIDGSCLGNPGPGGWAVVSGDGELLYRGSEENTTNNRMELQAAIHAVKFTILRELDYVRVFSDSKYVLGGINSWIYNWKNNGWKNSLGTQIRNKDLWEELCELLSKTKTNIIFEWVKAHAGILGNENADKEARRAANERHD